jgi:hypothetical protein
LPDTLCPACAPPHRAPREGCSCGFYAFKDLSLLASQCLPDDTIVFGRVELAGTVIEHDLGYRAEWARIKELIPLEGTHFRVMHLANTLGLPMAEVLSTERLVAMREELSHQGAKHGAVEPLHPAATNARVWRWVFMGYVIVKLVTAMANGAMPHG